MEGRVSVTQEGRGGFMEALDIALVGDVAWVVGMGGLLSFDVTDPAAPTKLSGPMTTDYGKLHRVEPLDGAVIATSVRESGLRIWDTSDPAAPALLSELSVPGAEGLAWVGGRLWVSVRGEGVRAYDASDPTRLVETARAAGLSAPWELAATGDGWLYAADNTLGVVPIDIRDPNAPVIGAPVPLEGPPLHVHHDAGRLYVAIGAEGVAVLDLADRAAPRWLHTVTTGGSAVMASVDDGRLWVADHEGVAVFDATVDPPAPLHRDDTEQFALAVTARGERGYVGDWNHMEIWRLDPFVSAGAASLPSDTLRWTGGVVVETTVTNRGAGPLTLTGASVDDPRVTLEVTATTLAPGASARLRLSDVTSDTTLCLASDDPDSPTRTLAVRASAEAPAGVPAPDFALTDLEGNTLRLSEQLGAPVLLSYFATW
jgi:hypothetical protein